MKVQIEGKRALVTGASSGIGRAIALALAEKGAKLALSARREPALNQLADEIAKQGHARPVVLTADLSKPGEAAKLAARATEALTQVDILVNNAGIGIAGTQFVVGDDPIARALFETNYFTPLALIRALVPGMRARKVGAVVNVSSIASSATMPLNGHYSASKAALARASEALDMELRGSGVHALHVLPGPVETAMLEELRAVGGDKLIKNMPIGKTDVLAKKVVRALERGTRTIVYPGSLSITRHFPTFTQFFTRIFARSIDVNDDRKLLGGSGGDPLAVELRAQFEEKSRSAA